MSLGLWIFASVVLIVAVYHKGFRKVLLWSGIVTVALALLGATGYFAYTRYTTWQADRAAQKEKAALGKGIRACMARVSTPTPAVDGTTPDFIPAAYFENLAACQAYPDLDRPPLPGGYVIVPPLPSAYLLDLQGKVAPIPPGATIGKPEPRFTIVDPTPKKTRVISATVTCDPVVVYDRDKYAAGDPEAIDSFHLGHAV